MKDYLVILGCLASCKGDCVGYRDALNKCYKCHEVQGGVGFNGVSYPDHTCPEICPSNTFVNENRYSPHLQVQWNADSLETRFPIKR